MANVNPFYVRPGGGNLGVGLQNLGGQIRKSREDKAAEQARKEQLAQAQLGQQQKTDRAEEATLAAQEAYKSGDPEAFAAVVTAYPEVKDSLIASFKFKNEATKNNGLMMMESIVADPAGTQKYLDNRVKFLESQGADPTHTLAEIEHYKRDPEGYQDKIKMALAGMGGAKKGLFSAKTMIMDNGTVVAVGPSGDARVTDPSGKEVTGKARVDAIREARQSGLQQKREESGIAVEQARRVAGATGREKRISDIRKDFSTRSRESGRQARKVTAALKAAGDATQGIGGSVKMQLAKLFPDIDVTDEALLDQSLKGLAIEQLSQFKGPTTDFEFEQVERATGALGDPKTANIARLKALDRANWFNKREVKQFNRYVKNGGDPDLFEFDFDEVVYKSGDREFTLQDAQDTAAANNMTIQEVLDAFRKVGK